MKTTAVLAAMRILVDTTEAFAGRNDYKATGILGWPIHRTVEQQVRLTPVSPVFDYLFACPQYLVLVGVELACALGLVAVVWRRPCPALLITLVICQLFSRLRNGVSSGEGSDQMHLLVLCGMTIFYSVSDPLARTAALWFIALQSMLAYVSAGIGKLRSTSWRNGTAIASVLTCESFTHKYSSRLVRRFPALSKVMCWSIIAFECCFPILLLAGRNSAIVVLLAGALFHLAISVFMVGFNGFLWTFLATYPCLWYVVMSLQSWMHNK